MKKVTTSSLLKMKQESTKITALTAYDASFAKLFDEQGIDVLLIGDSLGMVLKGDDDTLTVSLEDIAYHTRSVRKGVERAFVVADMPFMTYSTPEQTYLSRFKITGEEKSQTDILKATVDSGGEEQDRDADGHGGRQEQTYLN